MLGSREKPEAREMLINSFSTHTSTARYVGRMFRQAQQPLLDYGDCVLIIVLKLNDVILTSIGKAVNETRNVFLDKWQAGKKA